MTLKLCFIIILLLTYPSISVAQVDVPEGSVAIGVDIYKLPLTVAVNLELFCNTTWINCPNEYANAGTKRNLQYIDAIILLCKSHNEADNLYSTVLWY